MEHLNNSVQIVLFGADSSTLKQSKYNNIIVFEGAFSHSDLRNIHDGYIEIPRFNGDNTKLNVGDAIKKIKSLNNKNITIWSSKVDVDQYILLLFISYLLRNSNNRIYVKFGDEYRDDFSCIGYMTPHELEYLKNHELTKEDLNRYALEWVNINKEPNVFRRINNNHVECLADDSFDLVFKEHIENNMKIYDIVKEMNTKYNLSPNITYYLLEKLEPR